MFRRSTTFCLFLVSWMWALGCASRDPGSIKVGSPEVASRERLVNDRYVQDEWLREKLAQSDRVTFEEQGFIDTRSFLGLSTNVGVEADPNVLAMYNAESEAYLDQLERSEREAALQHRIKTFEQLAELRKLRQALSGASFGKNEGSTGDDDESGDGDGLAGVEGGAESDGDASNPGDGSSGKSVSGRPEGIDNLGEALLGGFRERLGGEDGELLVDPSDVAETKAGAAGKSGSSETQNLSAGKCP